MTCPDCHGIGLRLLPFRVPAMYATSGATAIVRLVPCPGCGGSGFASCCEGAVGCADECHERGTPAPRASHTEGE